MVGESHRYPSELLEAADALAKLVAADKGFEETMKRMAELTVLAIDGAEECSISLVRGPGKEMKTMAATADVCYEIDALQEETGEGPCMSSIKDHATFRIPNMEEDETWPTFSKRAAAQTGVRSMLSFVLRLAEDDTGALNLISTKTDAFSEEDIDTGTLFAAQAAVAMADALGHEDDREKLVQLEEGMVTRQVIGQAVGILMATRGVGDEAAFELLIKASQNSNIKLRDIAERVVQKSQDQ
ncbi:MAG: GAF and ANTAR domain-containing protein [Actinomycetota bacterium]|nr:GAF and ANTAR domain-containing protein [Actinomycetota bacterium]